MNINKAIQLTLSILQGGKQFQIPPVLMPQIPDFFCVFSLMKTFLRLQLYYHTT